MLNIKQYPTGPLSVNTYLVCDDVSKECIIIDLGGETAQDETLYQRYHKLAKMILK